MDQHKREAQDEALLHGYKSRLTSRHAVDETVSLQPQDLYDIEVTVRNVSSRGFMAECGEAVSIGSTVSLEVPGIGCVEAQVRWQIGRRMGGMFHDPISLSRCEWRAAKADARDEAA